MQCHSNHIPISILYSHWTEQQNELMKNHKYLQILLKEAVCGPYYNLTGVTGEIYKIDCPSIEVFFSF